MERNDSRPRRACVEKQEQIAKKQFARQELSNMNELFLQENSDATESDSGDEIADERRMQGAQSVDASAGKDMFNFPSQSPSVKLTLVQKANKGIRTPTTRTTKAQATTPSSRSARKPHDVNTPHAVRRKIASRLGKIREENLKNREDSDESENDDDDFSEGALLDEEADDASDYFSQNSRGVKKMTTNHTLSKLGEAMLTEEQITACLENDKDPHAKNRRKLLDKLIRSFDFWESLCIEGSNLLLYGLGSKYHLLEKLSDFLYDRNFMTMTVNGFLPTCSIQEIVTNILAAISGSRPKGLIGLQAQLDFINSHFRKTNSEHLFVLVNCIDAAPLISAKSLQALETLASAPMLHFIGTVNHINAPLLWDLNRARAMRWVWIDATTYEPYSVELSSDALRSSAANTLSSLEHVFASLTINAKRIFLLIANYTMENNSTSNFRGMPFQTCYHQCREAFLVNSDLTLRAQLTEFVDHDMIRLKKGHDGVDYLVIPIEKETLEMFVQQQPDDV
ncbi:origin recognition complex subunit 2 [Galendromus occidentalis]|uniref:Origin recognition complex subunit 2 n=1 Tax=Galendromus occidentalis TaxID=34638 RepID=A0AAJ6QPM9_9ACAR|nr:origin recognition complex subunit 2 [Galendromus occidentalis]